MRRVVLVTAWTWAGLVVAATLVVAVAGGIQGVLDVEKVGLLLMSPVYVALGLLIAVRQPGNRVSWLLFVVGTWFVVEGAADLRIGGQAEPPHPASIWDALAIIWLNSGFFFALIIPLFLLLYIFPTGRFLTRRWSWAGWLAGLVASIGIFVEAFATEIGPTDDTWTITNPIGFLEFDVENFSGLEDAPVIATVFGVGLVSLMVGGIPAIVTRYRRSNPLIRTQIKWVVYAMLLLAITLMSQIMFEFYQGFVAIFLFVFGLSVLPTTITIAITRYRLYEIDRLISGTIAYTLVVTLLGLIYAVGAVWLPTQLLGEQTSIFVAVSTLAVAALFNPVRKRILGWVDRRFYRAKYDAEQVVADFADRLQDATDLNQLTEDSVAVVNRTMQPTSVGIWVRTRQPQRDPRS